MCHVATIFSIHFLGRNLWNALCYRGVQLLRARRAAGARNICVRLADVSRIRRESGAYICRGRKCYAQNLRTMCIM
jgi:hypothetical protein